MTAGARLPVAILAGGLATRLRPLTDRVPKSLVDVAGRPFIVHQLALLRDAGVRDVVVLVGHLGDSIERALGTRFEGAVRIRYGYDGDAPRGTGGALRMARPLLGDAFLVLYGDSYLECDYAAIERAFLESGQSGLMTVFRNENRWDPSNVEYAGGRIVRYDKVARTPAMRHIDYGLGAFRAQAFDAHPYDAPFDLAAVYQRLLAAGDLAGFEVTTRFYEIGSPSGLAETAAYLASKHVPQDHSS